MIFAPFSLIWLSTIIYILKNSQKTRQKKKKKSKKEKKRKKDGEKTYFSNQLKQFVCFFELNLK